MSQKNNCTLEKENFVSENLFSIIYLILALFVIVSPILETTFGIFKLNIEFFSLIEIAMILFCVVFLIQKITSAELLKFRFDFLSVLLVLMLIFCSLSINSSIFVYYFFMINYILVACLFLKVDKKYHHLLGLVFIYSISIDVILGLVDLRNEFIPGLTRWYYVMSLQYSNPDFSSFVIILGIILALLLLLKSKKLYAKILMWICFLILNVGLFVGGVYSSEAAMFLAMLTLVIIFWIKNKKFPKIIFCGLLLSILTSFLVWVFPNMKEISTAGNNFFYESLAVIDHNLGTKLLPAITEILSKLFGLEKLDWVVGADGWDRSALIKEALNTIFSNIKIFLIGSGAGITHISCQPHNCFFNIWLDFGIFALLTYIAIIVYSFVLYFKSNKGLELNILFVSVCMLVFNQFFCYINLSFTAFVILMAIFYKKLFEDNLAKTTDESGKQKEKAPEK